MKPISAINIPLTMRMTNMSELQPGARLAVLPVTQKERTYSISAAARQKRRKPKLSPM